MRSGRSARRSRLRSPAVDEELLEPLPIFVDGVEVAPAPAAREMQVTFSTKRTEVCFDRPPAPVAAGPAARGAPRWPELRVSEPRLSHAGCGAAFVRMIALPADWLDSLPAWWREREQCGHVEIGQRLFLLQPTHVRANTWRMRGRLRGPLQPRAIPVELELWPRFDAWTKLVVQPQRDVHDGRRYYAAGHRAIDALCSELVSAAERQAPCAWSQRRVSPGGI